MNICEEDPIPYGKREKKKGGGNRINKFVMVGELPVLITET